MTIILTIGIIAIIVVAVCIRYIRSDEFQMRKAYVDRINSHPKAGSPKRK